ncbi:MAG TPA: hypothetical protein VIY86_09315, partial [Pirellulaceae bacterium]
PWLSILRLFGLEGYSDESVKACTSTARTTRWKDGGGPHPPPSHIVGIAGYYFNREHRPRSFAVQRLTNAPLTAILPLLKGQSREPPVDAHES